MSGVALRPLPSIAKVVRPSGSTQGLSLHPAVHCSTDERYTLRQLCRYLTRPAMINERVCCNMGGACQVVPKLKSPGYAGTARRVLSPLELMQTLAAL